MLVLMRQSALKLEEFSLPLMAAGTRLFGTCPAIMSSNRHLNAVLPE